MILRKPFAILIKNFKIIHFILTIFAFYLVYKTNTLLSFYSEYIVSYTSVIGKNLTEELFNPLMYVSIFIILLGSFIIFTLMLSKKKPIKLYIFNIIVYMVVILVYVLSYSVATSLEVGLVEVRTLKVIEDLLTSIFLLQIVSLCILTIRATGFNIKKFDFVYDLQDLQIEEADYEEFEVSVDVDSDIWRRKLNRTIRHIIYAYKENKIALFFTFFILIGVISTLIYVNTSIYNKLYKVDQAFQAGNYTMKLATSYATNKDVTGNKLFKEEVLIAILMDVKSNIPEDQILDSARFVLKIKDHYFYHLPEYKEKVNDLGIVYNKQPITANFSKYLFIYKIPTGFLEEPIVLQYTDYTDKVIQMKIDPKDIDSGNEVIEASLGETLDFKGSILNQTKLTLNSYYVDRVMKVDYDFCITSGCYESHEYLVPTYTGRDKKALLFLQGSMELDKSLPIQTMKDFGELITTFAEIRYTIGNSEKTSKLPMKLVNPNKMTLNNMCYLEVPEEVISAENIKIVFHIRNKTYIYIVK